MKRCIALLCLAACVHEEPPPQPSPPPADHQAIVCAAYEDLLASRHEVEEESDYRFGPPILDRIADWHWEGSEPGRAYKRRYRHGWSVNFWVKPYLVGFKEHPQQTRMAFFADGKLRGIFMEGVRCAPYDLDKWHADWVDYTWEPSRASAPMR